MIDELKKVRDGLVREYLKEKKNMSDSNINYFLKEFDALSDNEKSEIIYEMVGKEVYSTCPVGIKTFVNDPYYLGDIYGGCLFKIWRDVLDEVYPAPFLKKYDHIVLSCSTRAGKTYCTSIVMLYEIYWLTCMITPLKTLNVANIVIALLSKDNATAVSQIASEVYRGLTQSPYFKDVVREKLSFSKIDKEGVHITDDIIIKAGSSLSTFIGTNLYCCCMDEANAPSPRIAQENLIEARMRMYNEMQDRRRASYDRAPKPAGMLMFTSSPTDEGDVLSEIIEDLKLRETKGEVKPLIRDNISRWEAREEDMSETFEFFLGSDTKDPCVLNEAIELKPEEMERVIKIPIKYAGDFVTNPYESIQNIAGRRTMPEMALFNSVSVFERVFYKEPSLFTTDTPKITVGSPHALDEFLRPEYKNYFSNPDRPDCYRYIHLDMAYKCDRFGLTSVYSDRVKYTSEDGHEIYRRKYFIDFCLGVQAKNNESIDILKILEFVYSLKGRGYPLKLVTTDNHQGEIARQIIAKKGGGVKTEYLSMEKSKEQYLNMKNIIITEALEGYKNPTLMRELRGLRESQKKIEKGKGYTDDMSDSLAGALWSCSQDKFYKKNNEAITELISQSGKLFTNNMKPTKDFRDMAREINKQSPFRRTDLGFRYGR